MEAVTKDDIGEAASYFRSVVAVFKDSNQSKFEQIAAQVLAACHANFHLIEAAPDLLEALQKVTDVLDAFGDLPDGLMAPGPWSANDAEAKIAAARAAIAKARGEA